MSTQVCCCGKMVAPICKHLFVLTHSHLCFNVGLPPSFSLNAVSYVLLVKHDDQRCRLPYQKPSGHPAVLSRCELFGTSHFSLSYRTPWASPTGPCKMQTSSAVLGYKPYSFNIFDDPKYTAKEGGLVE